MNEATKRAEMPKGANAVLDRRTVAHGNANLLTILKPGHVVLDVGCGSGPITKGISDLVGPSGLAKGIDLSEQLIQSARQTFSAIHNLSFEVADINTFHPKVKYDVVSSARVLQWVSNPKEVLLRMKDLLKEGGSLTILDYNHEKIEFRGQLPERVKNFYDAFLLWRKDAGMDNNIADNLENIFKEIGLNNISIEDHSEVSIPDSPSFYDELSIWRKVAETRGKQLVVDQYITEEDRLTSILEYQEWMDKQANYMKLYLRSVTGIK